MQMFTFLFPAPAIFFSGFLWGIFLCLLAVQQNGEGIKWVVGFFGVVVMVGGWRCFREPVEEIDQELCPCPWGNLSRSHDFYADETATLWAPRGVWVHRKQIINYTNN